ncbi:unnamed protein product [Blepharisma stoltei]|uniref:Transmembrane protein n=1 Tax=Blepharisma stoltei TaxID=1481888 RepID=A0AAU9I4U3_9CILI|nr:unnamed protein product [Blepharisma stoltei]
MIIDFYTAGLRPKNCIFLIPNRIAYAQVLVSDVARKQILLELLYGSIVINEAEWLGDYGQEIWQGFLKYYYPFRTPDFKCLSFDGAILLLHGIKYTLNKGENVENATALNLNLRQQKFLGCSGSVSIESWSNNRNSAILGIYNMRWNASTNIIYESLCGVYNLGSEQLFTFTENLVWYNNKTKIPKDTIEENSDCPFNKNQVQYSRKGAAFFYALCLFIDVITLIMVFYIWSKWCNTEIPKLIKVSTINFEDYIEMGIIFIDFLQILSMGPDMSGYDKFGYNFSDLATLNIDWITKGKKLWFYVLSVVIVVALWIFLNIESTFKCWGNIGKFFCEFIRPLSKLVMPVVGNICFLPFISVLLSSFACYESIGPTVTQTFVHQDCSTFCWKNSHILWASLSIVSLIVYLPSVIYFRPLFGNSIQKNIKSRPTFWMVKSIFQINVVILNKALKVYYEWLFGFFYIAMILALIYFCYRHKPYNYERINLWLIILYFSDIWSILLSSIYSLSNYHSVYLWMSLQYVGWGILVIIGILIQARCYPSLLVTEDPAELGILFRFELGKSVKADEINQKKDVESSNERSPEMMDNEKTKHQEASK